MALEAPLRTSTGSIRSIYPSYAEMALSSGRESPALTSQYMASSSGPDSQALRPNSFTRPSSAHLMSPSSDIVGPSPVTSNGTETTEIEDEEVEDTEEATGFGRNSVCGPCLCLLYDIVPVIITNGCQLLMLKTNIPDHVRKSGSEEVVSVIHAPPNFQDWSPPMVNTRVRPVSFNLDAPTPQAQKLEDVYANESTKTRSSTASSLELIPEIIENDGDEEFEDADEFANPTRGQDTEVKALKAALEECWTLCNTLANLSSIHRKQVFHSSGTPDAHERAWKCCWKLCKRLYHSRDDVSESFGVRTNLDLCRDFCQSLFDVRQRTNETADSILRVSFELNNHAQDSRTLPEAFRERTLDFYITLCHRLMKQRNDLAEETDSLLRACWALAEMLFSLRQNRRDGKAPDEELLGSAVQACWELCDIFREGWTQVRPDRGTPRPNQVNFFAANPTFGLQMSSHQSEVERSNAGSRASLRSKRESLRSLGELERPRARPVVPETPVTEFEDTPISPDASPQMPNILVLGTSDSRSDRGGRWSSNASNLSGYSQNTSSTATTATTIEDVNITRIKALVVKAALNIGFDRSAPGADAPSALQSFVNDLPQHSFGGLPNQISLLQNYKNLVLADASFRSPATLPARGKRFNAVEVAKSVGWMMIRSGQYNFLRDLYRLVFGCQLEDADTRKNVSIVV
uniref:DUF7624 domain-containing protein n=2 Tax=Podospora anserina (strain S / ATCC MYA-4624 / DSM 980 / FGSC 10383) TaxID=515849 RepID=A0A090C8D5_PODAN|nr:Putative protein of unknown function [Podospora anserina S mat+]